MKEHFYPTLTERLKAAVVDILVLFTIMMSAAYAFSFFTNAPDSYRVFVFVFVFFLYEPLFISFSGGTVGHLALGLRVKLMKDPSLNVNFILAVIRFLVKYLLGWISFLTVTTNDKKRALHDMAVGSVVYYKNSYDSVIIT